MSLKSAYEIGHIKGLRAASEKIAADLGVSADAVFRDVCVRLMGTQGKTAADDRFFTGADAAIAGGGAAAGLGGVASDILSNRSAIGRGLIEQEAAAASALQDLGPANKILDHRQRFLSDTMSQIARDQNEARGAMNMASPLMGSADPVAAEKAKKLYRHAQGVADRKGLAMDSLGRDLHGVENEIMDFKTNKLIPAENALADARAKAAPHQNSFLQKMNKAGLTPERLKTIGTIGKITGGALGLGLLGKKTYDVATS